MRNTAPRLLVCVALVASAFVTACDTREVRRGRPRELARLTVDDLVVTVSVDVLDHHAALALRESGGGRGALPVGIRSLPSTTHWPVPVVRVDRSTRRLDVEDLHGDSGAAYRTTDALDESAALAAARDARATTCRDGERVAYRIVGTGYDSGFHGLYVRGDLAIHRSLPRDAATCEAAIASMPTLDRWIDERLASKDRDACERVALSRGEDDGFECSLRWPESTSPALRERLARAVAAGVTHTPDREAEVFACLDSADPARPGCAAYLASTTTPGRRREFLSRHAAACSGAGCLPFAKLVSEAARLADEDVCAAVFTRVDELASRDEAGLRDAGVYASALAACVPAARHERLAREAFLRDDGTRDDRVLSRCPPQVSRACRSLPRLGAAYVATSCDAGDVARSRAVLADAANRLGDAPVDAALIVLSRCEAPEARAFLEARVREPIPRARELAHFGLSPASP